MSKLYFILSTSGRCFRDAKHTALPIAYALQPELPAQTRVDVDVRV